MSKMKEAFENIVEIYHKYHAIYTLEECEEIVGRSSRSFGYWQVYEDLLRSKVKASTELLFLTKDEKQRLEILATLRSAIDTNVNLQHFFESTDDLLVVDNIIGVIVYIYNPNLGRSLRLPINLRELP